MTDPAPFQGLVNLNEAHAAPAESHDHREGHLKCPVCSLHDHAPDGRHPEPCKRCTLLGQALHRD